MLTDETIIGELTRLAEVSPAEVASHKADHPDGIYRLFWHSGGFGVGFQVLDRDRDLPLEVFSHRICVPAIYAWRHRVNH